MENKLEVFRKFYNRLKDGINTCCAHVANILYSQGLIHAEVRDSKDPDRILSAVETVLCFKPDENWDILINQALADPPLNCLADMMVKELESMPPPPGRSCSSSVQLPPPTAPTYLPIQNDPSRNMDDLDSGNCTSDKKDFPMFPGSPAVSTSTLTPSDEKSTLDDINEPPVTFDVSRNDSGIIDTLYEAEEGGKMNDTTPLPHLHRSRTEPASLLSDPVVAVTEQTLKSVMVSPKPVSDLSKKNKKRDISKKNDTNMMLLDEMKLKNEKLEVDNNHFRKVLQKLYEENKTLRSDIDSINYERDEDLKVLRDKLRQLASDNQLLSQKIEEKRTLEAENRRLKRDASQHLHEVSMFQSENQRLRSCLELAERNARIQSISIDKLRDNISSLETTVEEYRQRVEDGFHNWFHPHAEYNSDDVSDDEAFKSLPNTH